MDTKDFNRLPKWQSTLLVVGLIGAVGLVRFGVTVEVSYTPVPILAVDSIAGGDQNRRVTVEIDNTARILHTSDPRIETVTGGLACLETRKRLFKLGSRHRLALAFYCRKALARARQGAYL